MRQDYPGLRSLCGYLHEDFQLDHGSWGNALRAFLAEAPASTLGQARLEAASLLEQGKCEQHLESLIGDELGCALWMPGAGLTYGAWLSQVLIILDEAIDTGAA